MFKIFLKTILLLIFYVVVQQMLAAFIGTFCYIVDTDLLHQFMENPELAKDMDYIMNMSQELVRDPKFIIMQMGIGMASASVVYILLMLLFRLVHKNTHRTTWQSIVWALLLVLPLAIVGNIVVELFGVEDVLANIMSQAMRTPWGAVSIAVVGPIAEEVCFRTGIMGVFIKAAKQTGNQQLIPLGLMTQAVLFAGLHVNPAQVVFAVLLGWLFGWVYYISGSIWPCIVMHVANNSIAVIMNNCCPDLNSTVSLFGGTAGAVIVALACLGVIMLLLTKYRYVPPTD
ncbi:MAG: CPBP family intramembrane metalloprotease [Bacteroidaceae bacterium]|nr:CPBP family intramembrane metalloprotease [Bacteroidaceae bacterium]